MVQRQLDGGSALRTLFCGIMHSIVFCFALEWPTHDHNTTLYTRIPDTCVLVATDASASPFRPSSTLHSQPAQRAYTPATKPVSAHTSWSAHTSIGHHGVTNLSFCVHLLLLHKHAHTMSWLHLPRVALAVPFDVCVTPRTTAMVAGWAANFTASCMELAWIS